MIGCSGCQRPFVITDPAEIRVSADGLARMVRAECGCGNVAWLVRVHDRWIVSVLEQRDCTIVVRRAEAPR